MDSQKYFGRWYRLTLTKGEDSGDNGRKKKEEVFEVSETTPAMDIKFKVNYARAQTAKNGTISILGLGLKTIQMYTQLAAMDKGKALKQALHVKLEAGYLKGEQFTIFDGYATSATCGTPPELWLNIEVWEYNPYSNKQVEVSAMLKSDKRTVADAANQIVKAINESEGTKLTFEDATEDNICKQLKVPELDKITGSTKDVIAKMNEAIKGDVMFSLHDQHIFAYDKSDEKSPKEAPLVLSKDTGLLSVDGINPVNGCVTTFLKKPTRKIARVTVKSELNPHASGTYVLIRVEHVGHFNGREWYTKFHCSGRVQEKNKK